MYGSGGYLEVVIVAGGYQLFRAWKEKDLWKRISDAEAGSADFARIEIVLQFCQNQVACEVGAETPESTIQPNQTETSFCPNRRIALPDSTRIEFHWPVRLGHRSLRLDQGAL